MIGLEVSPPLDGGVLIDETGGVSALWVSCAFQSAPNQSAQVFRGLPINLVKKARAQPRTGTARSRTHLDTHPSTRSQALPIDS
eukprot:3682788-Pleurochrysis_carterae.AAC.1